MNSSLVSIIIVNWNGIRWLPGCFGSLVKQDWKNYEIIFVDNASEDESVAWVKKNYPKTKIIRNEENLGFSHANNIGYKKAKGEYILFLNNDTRVTKTFLSELIKTMETDTSIGGAQSKLLLMDKPDILDSVGAFLTPTGFLYHYGFGKKDRPVFDKQIDLYTAKGACMIFRQGVLNQIAVQGNVFDPTYFAYFEETDICHRIWLAGWRIVYAYRSVVYHKMGATSSLMNNAFVQYHSFKNRINSYLKNLDGFHCLSLIPFHILFSVCIAWYALIKGNIELWKAIHKALWWNIVYWKTTIGERLYIQKYIRRQTDSDFFPIIMRCPGIGYYVSLLSRF